MFLAKLVQFRTGHALVERWFRDRGIQKDEGYNCDCGELENNKSCHQTTSQKGRRKEEQTNDVSPNLVLPILLNTKPCPQAMAEFITTGRQHDKAELETRQFNQSSSR
jgi:hypothetical protein